MKGLVCLAAAITLVAAPSALAHETSYESDVEIVDVCTIPCLLKSAQRGSTTDVFVAGVVGSENDKCVAGRKVKVFAVSDLPEKRGGSGTKTLVDVATTSKGGGWGARGDFTGAEGVQAKVTKKNIGSNGHRHICEADTDLVLP
jgi:hypothetical protein